QDVCSCLITLPGTLSMKRLALIAGVFVVLAAAVVLARPESPTAAVSPGGDLAVTVEAKNPWTSLKLNNHPEQFHFAVVSHRTGGPRANLFSKAVDQVDLLQPTFVMSVGDLIEGYSLDPSKAVGQWDEFDGYAKNFQMPFFYVGGNHDLTNGKQAELWQERYGRKVNHFAYKNTPFTGPNPKDGTATHVHPE